MNKSVKRRHTKGLPKSVKRMRHKSNRPNKYYVARGKFKKVPRTQMINLKESEIEMLIQNVSIPTRNVEDEYLAETGRNLRWDLDSIVFEPGNPLMGRTLYDQADFKIENWRRGHYGNVPGEKLNVVSMFMPRKAVSQVRSNYIT